MFVLPPGLRYLSMIGTATGAGERTNRESAVREVKKIEADIPDRATMTRGQKKETIVGIDVMPGRAVERIWGRRDLPAPFDRQFVAAEPIGEIWYDGAGSSSELLVKFLFTSERLSIQVHPSDEEARKRGHRRGKDEAWLVLAAEPGAVIGLGLRRPVERERLRAAAEDGSIEELIDWRPVRAGDVFYTPAGTIHALGPGLSVVEIQQNCDLTYRLYDYGRPRELHLEDGIAVCDPRPYQAPFSPRRLDERRELIAEGGAFALERWTGPREARLDASADRTVTLVPLAGSWSADGHALQVSEVAVADSPFLLEGDGGELLVAYTGPAPIPARPTT